MGLTMSLFIMLGGVAVFMFGMKQMSLSMEQGAGAGVQKLFNKISKNRLTDYGIGIGATVIVQSSSAMSIMTVGLANAGIVGVKNGCGMILGAKVGTTVTAFIFALSGVSKGGFSMTAVFASLAFVGMMITFMSKDDRLNSFAQFITGFGLLFSGLELMETAIGGPNSILSVELQKVFQYNIMHNPICLVLLGVLFTGIIQSSTAATGLFLIFLTTDVIASVDQSFFLIMGANIGTCTDGLLASIGTNANGKRIAYFHLFSSIIGAVVFSLLLIIFRTPVINLFERLFPTNPAWSLATFNLAYNLIYTAILLAFLSPLVRAIHRFIVDRQPRETHVRFIDDRFIITPAVAIESALQEVYGMASLAQENLERAFHGLMKADTSESKQIAATEYVVDDMTRALASYFIKVSAAASSAEHEKLLGGLHHVINDIERIGDHAVDLAKETNYMKQREARFMDETEKELEQVYTSIMDMLSLALDTFQTRKTDHLEKIAEIHLTINRQLAVARDAHITRLNANLYSVDVSKSLYAALFSLERISDHTVNIAFSIRSDTGSKTEAFNLIKKDVK